METFWSQVLDFCYQATEQVGDRLVADFGKFALSSSAAIDIGRTAEISSSVDLKFKNDSATHEVPKLRDSKLVNEIILIDNHRHEALDDILNRLND